MVVFITSIRHPDNSNNFANVERLFEVTLRSVCAQDDPDFHVVVVCNARPRIAFDDPRVLYHVVDFPPPSTVKSSAIKFSAMARDKGTKLFSGMLLARALNPKTFMIFDADDYVSRRLSGFFNSHSTASGWFVDAGYLLNLRAMRYQRKSGLQRYCGTSLAPNADTLFRYAGLTPGGVNEHSDQEALLRATTPSFIDGVLGDHKPVRGYFQQRGAAMEPIPFRSAVWVQETGDNWTNLQWSQEGLPVNEAFCNEFGLDIDVSQLGAPSILDRARESVLCAVSKIGSMYIR